MRIARLTDRFIIKMGEISLEVSPLSGREKIELAGFSSWKEGKFFVDKPRQEHFVVKHSVKGITGVEDFDGKAYELSFEGSHLTDECAEEVLSLLASTWFTPAYTQMNSGKIGDVVSPIDGKPVPGVSIEIKGKQPLEEEAEDAKKK